MILINKKRIKIILGCILIALFTFTFQIADYKKTKENNNIQKNTIQTTSTPVSGKTVVLDAGHGVPDEGEYLLTLI